jgi:hypothetical protein
MNRTSIWLMAAVTAGALSPGFADVSIGADGSVRITGYGPPVQTGPTGTSVGGGGTVIRSGPGWSSVETGGTNIYSGPGGASIEGAGGEIHSGTYGSAVSGYESSVETATRGTGVAGAEPFVPHLPPLPEDVSSSSGYGPPPGQAASGGEADTRSPQQSGDVGVVRYDKKQVSNSTIVNKSTIGPGVYGGTVGSVIIK